MSDEPIRFYGRKNAYGEFSNFSHHPVTLKGKVWPTTEHYFQAQKFAGTDREEDIRLADSPATARRKGQSRKDPIVPDWDTRRIEVMREALRAKFTQHDRLRRLLLDTGEAELIEHTRNDRFWADGGDGSGVNMLGKLLMELRAELCADGDQAG